MKKFILFFSAILMAASLVQAQDSLQQYTGKYIFPEGSQVSEVLVSLDSGSLNASSVAGDSPLVKKDGDIFDITAFAGTAVFKRDSLGKVNGVEITVQDVFMIGKKEMSSSSAMKMKGAYKNENSVAVTVMNAKLP
jgi:hypothetical protein